MSWVGSGKRKIPRCSGEISILAAHNGGKDGEVVCALQRKPEGEACKKYQYDPLRREPRVAPSLHTSQFKPEDFQL